MERPQLIKLMKEIFGVIRALHPFRLTGASRDYIAGPACFDQLCSRQLAERFRLVEVVASDSGRIVILEYDGTKNMPGPLFASFAFHLASETLSDLRFEKVHQETFGKTGCRRIVRHSKTTAKNGKLDPRSLPHVMCSSQAWPVPCS